MASAARDDAHATIDRHPLAGDVFARIRRQQNAQAFEVFVVAQTVQRMLCAPHSAAKARVKLITAPLEVL